MSFRFLLLLLLHESLFQSNADHTQTGQSPWCKGDCQSQWKTPTFDPHSSETPQPIAIKFERNNYIGDVTHHSKFGFSTFNQGVSPYK